VHKKRLGAQLRWQRKYLWRTRNCLKEKFNWELKKRIMKCLLWSVALYAAEMCRMTQADRRKLEAFVMWIWKRMEKIRWLDKVTN